VLVEVFTKDGISTKIALTSYIIPVEKKEDGKQFHPPFSFFRYRQATPSRVAMTAAAARSASGNSQEG
jgi:hypothetical protein